MVEPGHDFDDGSEEGRPPLPPEDRLWRHPSEIGTHANRGTEALDARRRWLAATPSRASAWSAGLVGALLATGLVLLGTHLTTWLAPGGRSAEASLSDVTTTSLGSLGAVSETDTALAHRVAQHLVFVEAWEGDREIDADGVVVAANGMIAVPASMAERSSMLQVTLSDGEQFGAADVVGIDEPTGVAVVHIDDGGLSPLATVASQPRPGDWTAIEWATPSRVVLAIGSVRTARQASAVGGGPALLSAVTTGGTGSASIPRGSVLIDADGAFVGLVTDRRGDAFVEMPAALVDRIASELIAKGRVVHGWLGIRGASRPGVPDAAGRTGDRARQDPAGVRVTMVGSRSAAAVAGLRPGDVIEAVNGRRVATMGELQARLYLMPPQRTVSLEVERNGRTWDCKAMLQPAA
ncbi:MAG: S1C family serine protease [Acidimicrobiales bacterium]